MNETAARIEPWLDPHLERRQSIVQMQIDTARRRPERGFAHQRDARHWERAVKLDAVAFGRWNGLGRAASAARLGVSEPTLGRWDRRWLDDQLCVRPRGRPLLRSDVDTRNAVLSVLDLLGPRTGLPTLRGHFPGVPRAELKDLLRRWQRAYIRANGIVVGVLRWPRPGAVWAVDYTEAPAAIDGIYPYALAVRDLGSGAQLLWMPCRNADAQTAANALAALFIEHGAPLVLKSDNGGHLKAGEVVPLLAAWMVQALVSPIYTPQYNGAVEAGIGSMQTRTWWESARHDRPGHWTCDDLEAARLQANQTARPAGHDGPTPDAMWRGRTSISAAERAAFAATVARNLIEETQRRSARAPSAAPTTTPSEAVGRAEIGSAGAGETENQTRDCGLSLAAQAAVRRSAIGRALVEHGLLSIRRRRIALPIRSLKRIKIW